MSSTTKKLYEEQPYGRTFTAAVLSCRPAGEDASVHAGHSYAVELDQTLFFPEGGGQPSDTGTLAPSGGGAAVRILDVQESGGHIYHYADAPLKAGSEVTGEIDWPARFDNMQQHTGEHVVSGLAHQLYGLNNVGFHLSDQTVAMDYDGEMSPDQIDRLESEANMAIWENRPVTILYPTPEELSALDYRSKIDLTEGVRLVEIEGVDLCACCAPHVRSTAEVGLLKIVSSRRYKGGMRLWIVCGGRALADYRMLHEQSGVISEMLSSPRDALSAPVAKLAGDLEETKTSLIKAQESMLRAKTAGISDAQQHVLLVEPDMTDDKMIRDQLNKLAAVRSGYCLALFDAAEDTWRYICASTGSDCRTFNERMKASFPVRGGGKESMVQGSVTAGEADLRAWFEQVSE